MPEESILTPEPEATNLNNPVLHVTPAPKTDPNPDPLAPAPAPGLPDWLKDVDPDIANDPSLKVFKDHKDLVKSYVHAQKMIGKDKTVIPGKNSTAEDWKQFYNKVGLPDSVEDYTLEKGKNYSVHDDALSEFKKLAFENNILPGQAQKVMDWLNERANVGSQASIQQAEDQAVKGWNDLKAEWGNGFQKNINAGIAALKEFGDENLHAYFDEKGFTDDPMFARFMAKVGSSLSEDVFNDDTRTIHGMTPQEAQAKIAEIQKDLNGPYYNASHPDHKKVNDEMTKLWSIS